jgi:NitT/TauT family transport system substrate-binding protein
LYRRTLLAAAALAVLTAGAHGQNAPAPMNVGTIKMASLTNPWVAIQRGIFEKNGLKVNLVEFKSGAEAVAAIQGGSVDVILAIPGTAMTATERGFDLVAVVQNEIAKPKGPDSGSIQVVKGSPIKSLKDLDGKTVAVSQLHSQNAVTVQKLIKDAGVDLKKVRFIEIPFPSQVDALRSKQVDAVATVDPYTTQLQTSGVGEVIAWNYSDAIPEQPLGAWFAKRAYIKAKPDMVEKFAKSIKESIDYMNADPARARKEVSAYTGLDPALVEKMPHVGWDYRVREDKWNEVITLMRDYGSLRKEHKAKDFWADQILPDVVK